MFQPTGQRPVVWTRSRRRWATRLTCPLVQQKALTHRADGWVVGERPWPLFFCGVSCIVEHVETEAVGMRDHSDWLFGLNESVRDKRNNEKQARRQNDFHQEGAKVLLIFQLHLIWSFQCMNTPKPCEKSWERVNRVKMVNGKHCFVSRRYHNNSLYVCAPRSSHRRCFLSHSRRTQLKTRPRLTPSKKIEKVFFVPDVSIVLCTTVLLSCHLSDYFIKIRFYKKRLQWVLFVLSLMSR